MKSLPSILALLLVSFCTVSFAAQSEGGYMGCRYPKSKQSETPTGIVSRSASGTILYGVDVSTWEGGNINWDSMKAAEDFAIIRSSYGNGHTDDQFGRNRDEARRVGILRGFYHYSYPEYNTATAEADWFCSVVGTPQAGEVLVLDFEESYSDPPGWSATFCERVHSKLGIWPYIYLNLSFVTNYNWSRVVSDGVPLWLARWDNVPDPTVSTGGTPWSFVPMKQYYDKGSVIGISPIDVDVFNGDAAHFKAYGGSAPVIATQPVGGSNNTGTPITMTCLASGTPVPTYQWRLNGVNISGATTSSYTTAASGNYDCAATNTYGTAVSDVAVVNVNTNISILTQPVGQSIAFGATATLTVVVKGSNPTYQWKCNGLNVAGATSASYITGSPGSYNCYISNSFSSATTNMATVIINNATTVTSVAAAKQLTDGTIVAVKGRSIVTRVFDGIMYIEDSDRTAGIKVDPAGAPLPLNANAITYARLSTTSGERLLDSAVFTNGGAQPPVTTLAMTCKSASVPLAQGLLVTLSGRASVAPGATNTFELSDGSASMTVICHGVALPADGAYKIVQGMVGDDSTGPILNVSQAGDIR